MRSTSGFSTPYSLSFTAASLRPELARIVAEAYLEYGDWQEARRQVLARNALQARTASSGVRMEREIRQRVQTLSEDQIRILVNSSADSRAAIAWLSVLKSTGFVFVFATQTLRGKIEAHDPVLRPSDYEDFLASESVAHPELRDLTASTKYKIRQVLIRMLREAGILGDGQKDFALRRASLPHDVLHAIVADDRRWLAGFLVPDSELQLMGA